MLVHLKLILMVAMSGIAAALMRRLSQGRSLSGHRFCASLLKIIKSVRFVFTVIVAVITALLSWLPMSWGLAFMRLKRGIFALII